MILNFSGFKMLNLPTMAFLVQARVKVEHLIREHSLVDGLEMLSCLCDLLLARFSLIETEKRLPAELKVCADSSGCGSSLAEAFLALAGHRLHPPVGSAAH